MAKKKESSKWVFPAVVISIILVILIITLTGNSKSEYTNQKEQNNYQGYESNVNTLESCPYECCLGGNYLTKQCSRDYECINNKCNAVDSDGDGLTDIDEKRIGTNPQLYDTDGDMLNDYQEYKILGTNPLKKNTDGDRYDDNEDTQPTTKNTANIYIEGTFNSIPNYINIGLLVLGIGALSPDLELYSTNVELNIINDGNDYSSYGSYDVVLSVGENIIDVQSFSFGMVDVNSIVPSSTSFSTTLVDIPSQLISLITQQATPIVEIKNLEYERF